MFSFLIVHTFFDYFFNNRNECTEQCLKRKRDLENETREIRKLINDKDERIKTLDNEIKVSENIYKFTSLRCS